ncbi:MAG: hypothetical protein M3Z98_02215, partial [Candidatus Dormibacteraeota bacterium]|nr:hypothetical protein [Candidatus Dormibacteraeota bacterium]
LGRIPRPSGGAPVEAFLDLDAPDGDFAANLGDRNLMRCETCGAPAVLLANACVFCRTPVADSHAPADLLDYLAAKLPAARVKRYGLRRRGPVRELVVTVGDAVFSARVARGRLMLLPDLAPASWVDRLLGALSTEAAADADLRARLSRSGWKLRPTVAGTSGKARP